MAGSRIACLLVPDLPLAAALRAQPELAEQAVAIATGPGPRAEILSVSPEAARRGVRPFTTTVQARAACAELRVRVASPSLERAARAALLDVALSASPRVEAAPPSAGLYAAEAVVFLDATGTGSLFRSEAGLAAALEARATRLGLPPVVAIAGSRPTAHIAARKLARGKPARDSVRARSDGARQAGRRSGVQKGRNPARQATQARKEDKQLRDEDTPPASDPRPNVEIVHQDAAYLAPLPIDLLDPAPPLAEALTRFGIRRIGELARLPRSALLTRLGAGARELLDLARGASRPPLPAAPASTRCEEALDLEHPLEHLEPLAFVLRGLLSRLGERLACRGLGCGDLDLRLALDGGGRDARRVGVAAPTGDVRVLLRLLCLSLEARPPGAAIEGVALATEGRPLRADQLDLFRPAGPAPALLARTVAELEALCGPGRVGAPALADSHRPDAWAVAAFAPASVAPVEPRRPGAGELSLRALRPPVAAEVRVVAGRPVSLRSAVANGRVTAVSGPWRSTGAWWSAEERFALDHFDVWTSDGTLCRLRLDRIGGRWEIDAVYD